MDPTEHPPAEPPEGSHHNSAPVRVTQCVAIVAASGSALWTLISADSLSVFVFGVALWTAAPFLILAANATRSRSSPPSQVLLVVATVLIAAVGVLAYGPWGWNDDPQFGLVFLSLPLWQIAGAIIALALASFLSRNRIGPTPDREPHEPRAHRRREVALSAASPPPQAEAQRNERGESLRAIELSRGLRAWRGALPSPDRCAIILSPEGRGEQVNPSPPST